MTDQAQRFRDELVALCIKHGVRVESEDVYNDIGAAFDGMFYFKVGPDRIEVADIEKDVNAEVRSQCAVEESEGIHCPNPPKYVVRSRGETAMLCEQCYRDTLAGVYGNVPMQLLRVIEPEAAPGTPCKDAS